MKYFFWICFLFLSILTYLTTKRMQVKAIGSKGYVGLLVFSVGAICLISFYMLSLASIDVYKVFTSGKTYNAYVVDAKFSHISETDDGIRTEMYIPIVSFTTDSGQNITTELDFSTSGVKKDDVYKVNYNIETGKVITLGFTLVLKAVIPLIFSFVLGLAFMGIIKYAFGHNMYGYKDLAITAIFIYFIPFMMIIFDLLLIYGLFYGNKAPVWVSLVLVFFIIVLTLGIVGYLKQITNLKKQIKKNKK